jgi:hypothetical protein
MMLGLKLLDRQHFSEPRHCKIDPVQRTISRIRAGGCSGGTTSCTTAATAKADPLARGLKVFAISPSDQPVNAPEIACPDPIMTARLHPRATIWGIVGAGADKPIWDIPERAMS